MAIHSQIEDQDKIKALESQIRECYGRVSYSHKTHEKMTDICLKTLKRIKISEILESGERSLNCVSHKLFQLQI